MCVAVFSEERRIYGPQRGCEIWPLLKAIPTLLKVINLKLRAENSEFLNKQKVGKRLACPHFHCFQRENKEVKVENF